MPWEVVPTDIEKANQDAKTKKREWQGDLEVFEQEQIILSEICRDTNVPAEKLRLCICNMHHGKKEKNPVNQVYFFKKNGVHC